MNIKAKTIRIAVAVATIALAAAGAAIAASKLHGSNRSAGPAALGAFVSGGSSGRAPRFDGRGPGGPGFGFRHDDLADAASYLGIGEDALRTQVANGKTLAQVADATAGKSASGLIDALVAAESKEIDAAVTAGSLTQAQAAALKANLKAHETAEVNGTFRGPGFGRGHGPGPGDGLSAAAAYLGTSVSDLLSKLQSGQTLGQIADATSGKSKAGLIDALVKHEQQDLAQAVKDGRLTQAQADQISAGLTQRVTDMVNGTFRGHDHDGPGGPPPAAPETGSGTHI
ncbi:MAG TPA: hypothetical protein VI408_06475 [Gaiellaceae bacterium]